MLRSLNATKPAIRKLVLMYTPTTIRKRILNAVAAIAQRLANLDVVAHAVLDADQLLLSGSPASHEQRFPGCIAKLALWQLVQFESVLYLDADTVVIRNIDSYFARMR